VAREKPEEETYSLIYTSLRHPIRRKILRMLMNKPLTFSEILEAVDIDSGHLNYHLENLGDLITHSQDGKYQLSSLGSAAVRLMGGVEEHHIELSKPKLKLTKVFAKAYPLILSAVLIIAGLYFVSYATVTKEVANGVGWMAVLPIANFTFANLTANNESIVFYFNATPLNDNATINGTQIENVGFTMMANENDSIKMLKLYIATYILVFTTTTLEQTVKPYFYYGIAALAIALVYPAFVLIEALENLGHKPKPRKSARERVI